MTGRFVWSALLVLAVGGRLASAQSLGELARQEEARRKAIAATSKIYTNDNVGGASRPQPASGTPAAGTPAPGTPAAPPSQSGVAPAGAPAGAKAPAADDKAKPAADPKKDEAMWRERIQAARDALQRAQLFADALQSRINGLSADFASRDDPAQRASIGTDRQKALAELDRVKKEIDQHTKSIAAIQDEARKAGVPPGWLR
jgi:hypothetical protein